MHLMNKAPLIICLFLLIAMGPGFGKSGNKQISPLNTDKLINSRAPEFTLNDPYGKSFSLSDYSGKVVLLNFWATWCPPCTAEMPALNRLYLETKDRGFEILAVSTDRSVRDVHKFLEKNRVDFPILFDGNLATSKLYKVFSMPTTFLIDRDGVIVEKFYGEYNWTEPETRGRIEKLL
jgi:cytochrome c biogenesis protein CcmG, thiol:disulfide interchange protein DsbE